MQAETSLSVQVCKCANASTVSTSFQRQPPSAETGAGAGLLTDDRLQTCILAHLGREGSTNDTARTATPLTGKIIAKNAQFRATMREIPPFEGNTGGLAFTRRGWELCGALTDAGRRSSAPRPLRKFPFPARGACVRRFGGAAHLPRNWMPSPRLFVKRHKKI